DHGFRDLSHLGNKIDAGGLLDLQVDVAAHNGAEAGRLYLYRIRTRHEGGKVVDSHFIRLRIAGDVGSSIGDGYGGAHDHRTGGVLHFTGDGAERLPEKSDGQQEEQSGQTEGSMHGSSLPASFGTCDGRQRPGDSLPLSECQPKVYWISLSLSRPVCRKIGQCEDW